MNTKINFLAPLLGLIAICCTPQLQALSVDSITVAGKIRNIADGMPRTIIINECDISEKSVREVCSLDSDGSFCQKIPLSYPHTFSLNYNIRNFINAFASPGDSVYIDIDAGVTPVAVTYSGDNAELNRQFNSGVKYIVSLPRTRLAPDTVPADEYLATFKKIVNAHRDSIDSYARRNNLPPDVVKMLRAESLYSLANLTLDYRGRGLEDKRRFCLDPVFDIFDEDNTKVMIFPYHLSAIMNYFTDVRDNAPKGIIRDLMYACDEEATPARDDFFNEAYYDRLYSDEPAQTLSIDDIKPGNIIVFTPDGKIEELSGQNPLTWLIERYKGLPIFLDVSWTECGPCLSGLRLSEGLRNHFKDTDLRFAVIWLRSPRADWEKIAPTITNATHILVEDVEMSDILMKHLSIHGFPSYFMIDRDGNITADDVPNYHSEQLTEYLNSMLQ